MPKTPAKSKAKSAGKSKTKSKARTKTRAKARSKSKLRTLKKLDGFIGACLVDSESGMTLEALGGGKRLDLEMAAAGNTEVVRAKRKIMQSLGLKDKIEDILISLGGQYHIIRPLTVNDTIFVYLALDRESASLGLARLKLREYEKTVEI